MHRRLQSITAWLSPKDSSYSFVPLSSSQANSPDLLGGSAFAPSKPPLSRRFGTPPLLTIWLYISPTLVVVLLLALIFRPAPQDDGVLNPYICKPKAQSSTLAMMCEEDPKTPDWTMKAETYELGLDRHLTHKQCDAIFPGLYQEADRTRDYWKARGGITTADLDAAEEKGQARAMIIDNRLYVKSYSDEQQGTRTKATLAGIHEALIGSLEPVPDVEFVIMTGDTGLVSGAPWVLGRKEDEESLTLMPDYGFWSWPEPGVGSFLEVQDKTKLYEAGLTWKQKIPKLFWRGAMMVDIRKEFWEVAKDYAWGEVSDLDWLDKDAMQAALLTAEEHCQYKYLGHVEGWAYSGRLKYLQQCRSVVVAHKMKYLQHFHHLFNSDPSSPDQNIVISPGRNFDELPATMEALLKDDARAEKIADNSYNFFRHWLSPASVDCYWRRLIQRWAEIQTFEPVLTRNATSYESFILLGKTHWIPY